MPYNHLEIEPKWQARWDKANVGEVHEDQGREKSYNLIMFPYPSGDGLHVGHVESYTAADIISRFERMNGKNVLFPIGFDAFGLPAENFAIKTGTHPAQTTKKAIANFRRQMKTLGLSFDWSREISTAEPEYYKWTQWLFLKLYENDLAYRAKSPVNWCESCHTVLANEQVVDGKCERCKNEVVQKELEQWFFRITKYAEELLEGLNDLDWPEKIKAMQRHWIGKSEGVEIDFPVVRQEMERHGDKFEYKEFSLPVFTTRPDTLMGVTYIVLAPEHPLVDELTAPEYFEDVVAYRNAARHKSELERTQLEKDKTGVFIGATARHPITQEEVPIWIADYALMNYGTGAVMAVPAHDERDFTFAQKYSLPIKQVISPNGKRVKSLKEAYVEPGFLVNSEEFNGLTSADAKQKIADFLEANEKGRRQTNYRLRDWLVSRQRYWGAPIPIIWCEGCGSVPVPEDHLPVHLPEDVDFKPTGESPLARSKDFQTVHCPKCHAPARRESDTMDTFVDSSWYYLRYADPHNHEAFASTDKIAYWCPVDLYIGGAEHAVMHLLYARFFVHALHDLGLIKFKEPFLKLRNQGLILGPDGDKMSKSKGNVVNPDEIVEQFGADTLRIYEMFMGPLEDAKPWNTEGAVGVRRFLDKVWNTQEKIHGADEAEMKKLLHKTIKKVTEDIQSLKFNTAVSQLMIMANAMQTAELVSPSIFAAYLILLAPFAPHLAEELWQQTGHKDSVFAQTWPKFDQSQAKDDLVAVAIQVNGKLRGTMEISSDLSESDARARAEAVENVAKHLEGKKIVKVIYVPGRMVNLLVK